MARGPSESSRGNNCLVVEGSCGALQTTITVNSLHEQPDTVPNGTRDVYGSRS